MELKEYILANFEGVRVVGVVNPTIIITLNGISFTVYQAAGQKQGKYVACRGEDRHYFDEFAEIKKIIQQID